MNNDFSDQLETICIALEAIQSQIEDMIKSNTDVSRVRTLRIIEGELIEFKTKLELLVNMSRLPSSSTPIDSKFYVKPVKCPVCSIILEESEYTSHLSTHSVTRERGY